MTSRYFLTLQNIAHPSLGAQLKTFIKNVVQVIEVQVIYLKGTFYSIKVLKSTFAGWQVTARLLKLS